MLYLLHGLSDDHTIWPRRTSIERYVAPLGLAVVMPQVHRSFYADEAHGNRYWTFLTRGAAVAGARVLPALRPAREDTFVAGLSMGGYGALKWALRRAGSVRRRREPVGGRSTSCGWPQSGWRPELVDLVFGSEPIAGTDNDLFALVERASTGRHPAAVRLLRDADDGFDDNQRLVDAMRRRGLAVTDDFGPGDHDWAYWDARIQDVLAWLPLASR